VLQKSAFTRTLPRPVELRQRTVGRRYPRAPLSKQQNDQAAHGGEALEIALRWDSPLFLNFEPITRLDTPPESQPRSSREVRYSPQRDCKATENRQRHPREQER